MNAVTGTGLPRPWTVCPDSVLVTQALPEACGCRFRIRRLPSALPDFFCRPQPNPGLASQGTCPLGSKAYNLKLTWIEGEFSAVAFKKKPLVGVTGPDKGGRAAWWATRYALRRAGARACWIRPGKPRAIEGLDGLVIGGGADVAPALYGEEQIEEVFEEARQRHTLRRKLAALLFFPLVYLFRLLLSGHTTAREDQARDALETALIREGLDRNLPILGICRGSQLLNVVLGGSLHQELRDYYTETPQIRSVLPRKRVALAPGSRLSRILDCQYCKVNALHKQAINTPGQGLNVVAREHNEVIQAVEHADKTFVIGVQWHPEYMPQSEGQFGLFQALVEAARDAHKAAARDSALSR